MDGPISKRVAVLDFNAEGGNLQPGAPFERPGPNQKFGRYRLVNAGDLAAPDVAQVSVFGTIFKTIYMYEEPDTLGRSLAWRAAAPRGASRG